MLFKSIPSFSSNHDCWFTVPSGTGKGLAPVDSKCSISSSERATLILIFENPSPFGHHCSSKAYTQCSVLSTFNPYTFDRMYSGVLSTNHDVHDTKENSTDSKKICLNFMFFYYRLTFHILLVPSALNSTSMFAPFFSFMISHARNCMNWSVVSPSSS